MINALHTHSELVATVGCCAAACSFSDANLGQPCPMLLCLPLGPEIVSRPATAVLLQMSIIQLYLKRKHRWTDVSFNEQCELNHKSRGPGNLYPRSLWLMRKIAGVADARKIQVSQESRSVAGNVNHTALQYLPCGLGH